MASKVHERPDPDTRGILVISDHAAPMNILQEGIQQHAWLNSGSFICNTAHARPIFLSM